MTFQCKHCCGLPSIEGWCKSCGRGSLALWDKLNAKEQLPEVPDDPKLMEKMMELERQRRNNVERYGQDWPHF